MRKPVIVMICMSFVVASCQKKAEGQTVAIVNGEEITAAELNAELGEAAASAANQKDLRNAALQRLIDRKLVVQQAKNEDIDKSPEFLNRQRRANDFTSYSSEPGSRSPSCMRANRRISTAHSTGSPDPSSARPPSWRVIATTRR